MHVVAKAFIPVCSKSNTVWHAKKGKRAAGIIVSGTVLV